MDQWDSGEETAYRYRPYRPVLRLQERCATSIATLVHQHFGEYGTQHESIPECQI